MILYPAIDLLNGRAVRLRRGDFSAVTDYGDPVEQAKEFEKAGAAVLHIVDLLSSKEGGFAEEETVKRIVKSVSLPVQLGGGVRTMEDISRRLKIADRVVLGTAAAADAALMQRAAQAFPGRVVAGIDAFNWKVAVRGWSEVLNTAPDALARRMLEMGVGTVIFTDISKDGMLEGPSFEQTRRMVETGAKVIASGGIRSIDDLTRLKAAGVYGAVVGKALYEGAIHLKEAIVCLQNE